MRILLTGASGFIGRQLLAGLRTRGHAMVAVIRDPQALHLRFPGVVAVAADFNRDMPHPR